MTGPLNMGGNSISNVGTLVVADLQAVTQTIVTVTNVSMTASNLTLQGVLDMGGYGITNLGSPTAGTMAATKGYVDAATNSTKVTSVSAASPLASSGGATPEISLAGQLSGANITNGAISADKLQDGAVTAAKIADATITSDKLQDGAVTTAKIADATITSNKLGQMDAATGQVLKWTGTAWAPAGGADLVTVSNQFVLKTGDTLSGALNMGGNDIVNLGWPNDGSMAATRGYVDELVGNDATITVYSVTSPPGGATDSGICYEGTQVMSWASVDGCLVPNDASEATCYVDGDWTYTPSYMVVTGFVFNIPESAVIVGVEMCARTRTTSGGFCYVYAQLVTNEFSVSDSYRTSWTYSSSETTNLTLGSVEDLWDLPLTAPAVNSPLFGAARAVFCGCREKWWCNCL